MERVLKDRTNNQYLETSFTSISTRPIFKPKRLKNSAHTKSSTLQNSPELLERSVEKAARSPSPLKAPVTKTPAPSLPHNSVRKHLDFSEDLCQSFSQLKSPSQGVLGKRKRRELDLHTKRQKRESSVKMKMCVELFEYDGSLQRFRCYKEQEVVACHKVLQNLIVNECDDDCPTDDAQITVCISELEKQLKKALDKEFK